MRNSLAFFSDSSFGNKASFSLQFGAVFTRCIAGSGERSVWGFFFLNATCFPLCAGLWAPLPREDRGVSVLLWTSKPADSAAQTPGAWILSFRIYFGPRVLELSAVRAEGRGGGSVLSQRGHIACAACGEGGHTELPLTPQNYMSLAANELLISGARLCARS